MSRHKPKTKLPLVIQCNCCDYTTLREQNANELCDVCYWEDDGIELNRIFEVSPPNDSLTLHQARINFGNLGACNSRWLEKVCPITERGKFAHRSREKAAWIFEVVRTAENYGVAASSTSAILYPPWQIEDELIAYEQATEKSFFLLSVFNQCGRNGFHNGELYSWWLPRLEADFQRVIHSIADERGLAVEVGEPIYLEEFAPWLHAKLTIEERKT